MRFRNEFKTVKIMDFDKKQENSQFFERLTEIVENSHFEKFFSIKFIWIKIDANGDFDRILMNKKKLVNVVKLFCICCAQLLT